MRKHPRPRSQSLHKSRSFPLLLLRHHPRPRQARLRRQNPLGPIMSLILHPCVGLRHRTRHCPLHFALRVQHPRCPVKLPSARMIHTRLRRSRTLQTERSLLGLPRCARSPVSRSRATNLLHAKTRLLLRHPTRDRSPVRRVDPHYLLRTSRKVSPSSQDVRLLRLVQCAPTLLPNRVHMTRMPLWTNLALRCHQFTFAPPRMGRLIQRARSPTPTRLCGTNLYALRASTMVALHCPQPPTIPLPLLPPPMTGRVRRSSHSRHRHTQPRMPPHRLYSGPTILSAEHQLGSP